MLNDPEFKRRRTMATLEGVASIVQQLQTEMEAVKTRIVAAETLAQTRADILDNYVEAAANIHKAIDAQGTKISDAVSTQMKDVITLRKHTDDTSAALTKQLADLTGDTTSLQVEVNALKNETATKESVMAVNTVISGKCAGMEKAVEAEVTALKLALKKTEAELRRLADHGIAAPPGISGTTSFPTRPLLETKSVQGLKNMGSDKKFYNEWNEKLCNAVGEVMPGMREVLRWVRMRKDNAVNFVDYENAGTETDPTTPMFHIKWDRANESLYSVLLEKTEGEARDRVKEVPEGDGLEAYRRIHRWFTMTTGQGLSERYGRLQHPPTAKRDEDVLHNLANWEREKRELKELDPTMQDMPERFQMEAIRKIVPISSKLRDHLDEKEDELDTFEKLRNCITSWGLRKKKAENREQASMDMDVGSVGLGKGINSARSMEDTYYDPWYGQIFSMVPVTSNFTPEEQTEIYNYSMGWMGKGKGMMKGGKGGKPWGKGGPNTECYNCGGKGHIAINCPKGKGKGKGDEGKGADGKNRARSLPPVFYGRCLTCGEEGHSWRYCPKGKSKGKGKGLNEVTDWGGEAEGSTRGQNEEESEGTQGAVNFGGNVGAVAPPPPTLGDFEVVRKKLNKKKELRQRKFINCNFQQCSKDNCQWKTVEGKCLGHISAVGSTSNSKVQNINKERNQLDSLEKEFEKLSVNIDSGAIDHIMEERNAKMFATKPSPMSKYQRFYQAANKTRIYNKGQKDIKAVTGNGTQVDMTFQVADQITQPLGSVRRLCEAGNRVVFDKESYIENKATGVKTPIQLRNGEYMMDLYVRKDGKKPTFINSGRFQALMETLEEEEEEEEEDKECPGLTCEVCGATGEEACAASCWSCRSGF